MSLTTPISVELGTDGELSLLNYVYDNIIALKDSYSPLHSTLVPKWRRLTKGRPKEETRYFPWPNASNVVIQVIGENVDTIKAIQLGSIFEMMPLWSVGLIGDWKEDEQAEEQRAVQERFMDEVGLSQTDLDLYRLESRAAFDIASLGSVLVKIPYVVQKEAVVVSENFAEADEKTIYDGPKPEKLAYEDWAVTPTANTWEEADFKYHTYTLKKHQCEQKVHEGSFDKDAWAAIENSPDEQGSTEEQNKRLEEQHLSPISNMKNVALWRFYECWFKYWHNNKKYSICYTIHLQSRRKMRAFFNFYPNNEEPFAFGRLGYSDDGLIGYGFAEMGEMIQEEISTTHNQRTDNNTLKNTSVVLGGRNSRMDAGISLFPMAVLPFNKDEIEIVQLGTNAQSTAQDESLSLALSKARFGTDIPGAEGAGSGTVDRKGNYSAQGTFAIMQQGTRRINVNVTDFRYLHLNIGIKCNRQYAYFGIAEDKIKRYGEKSELLSRSFKNIKDGRMGFPIRAVTASINREIEKQTGMLFTQVMQRHYGAIAQILQGVTNPAIPPPIVQFLIGSIGGMSIVMDKLLRAFGYDDIYRMQPERDVVKQIREMMKLQGANNNGQQTIPNAQGTSTPSNGAQGVSQVAGA